MSDEVGSLGVGSLDIWCPDKRRHEFPHWEPFQGHETPFSAMAHLLRIWPGKERAYEASEEEAHLRIMQLISGYPLIREGRRPLDEPLNQDAQLSFHLSSFLDKIFPLGENGTTLHSLPTCILHHDLNFAARGNRRNRNYSQIFHYLMRSIRNGCTFGAKQKKKEFSPENLHEDEIKFITEVRSQIGSSYWPTKDEGGKLLWNDFERGGHVFFNADEGRKKGRNFLIHGVRFAKIQYWLRRWGTPEMEKQEDERWMSPNVSHKMVIGASSMLEASLSALRTKILEHKRAGSIVVDGGGQLRYISTDSKEEEKTFIRDALLNSLLLPNILSHPYHTIIERAANDYLELLTKPKSKPFLKRLGIDEEKFEGMKNESGKANSKFWNYFVGREGMKHFLPLLRYSDTEDLERGRFLWEENTNQTPQQCHECCLCNQKKGRPSGKPANILKKGIEFVCFFHFFVFEIGNLFQTRQKGNLALVDGTNIVNFGSKTTVNHLVMFDGNGIGSIFTKFNSVDERELIPHVDKETAKLASSLYEEISLPKVTGRSDPNKEAREKLIHFRHSLIIGMQRKAQIHNSTWWTAFHETLVENGIKNLIPWIIAGDDVMLVNESRDLDDEQIWGWLTAFIDRIVSRMPNGYPISLAGAVVSRDGHTITSAYEEAKKLEKLAGYAWKERYMQQIMQKYGDDAEFSTAMKNYLDGLKKINFTQEASSMDAKQELDKILEREWAKTYGQQSDVYLHFSKISKLAAFKLNHPGDVEQAIMWLEKHPQFYVKHENNLHSLFLTNSLNQMD